MSIGQGNHMAAPENIEALNFSDQKKQNTQTKTCLGITKHTPQTTKKLVVYFNGKQAVDRWYCNLPLKGIYVGLSSAGWLAWLAGLLLFSDIDRVGSPKLIPQF